MKKVILTGDRPTGKLHLGHFVGSLQNRVKLQNSGDYDCFIFLADLQALTDNARNPGKIRESILEVALDYLAVGLDPAKSTLFVQSQIPALSELTMYYMNLVSLPRLLRNPTVKTEIAQRFLTNGKNPLNHLVKDMADVAKEGMNKMDEFRETGEFTIDENFLAKMQNRREKTMRDMNNMANSVPTGFVVYPISQAADITAFGANFVPVGVDQLPMIEQTREIVRAFNQIYGDTLVEPEALIPEEEFAKRLPGTDGGAKMSKSLNNGIYLADSAEVLREKVFAMYTDPEHIHVADPGKIAGNTVFTYLDVFAGDVDKVRELKNQYQAGGLGDVTVKKYLFEVLNEILTPIRERRAEFAKDPAAVMEMLQKGSERANVVANQTLQKVRAAVGVNYFAK